MGRTTRKQITIACLTALLLAGGLIARSAPPPPAKPGAPAAPAKPIGTDVPQTSGKQMLSGTKLSFKCDKVPAKEAIELLEDTINFPLRWPDDEGAIKSKKSITLDDQNVSFMTVIRHVCEKGDLIFSREHTAPGVSIVLTSEDPQSECAYFPRQTDASLVPVIAEFHVNPNNPRMERRMTASVTLVGEPKVYLVGYYRNTTLDAALDDHNRSILPDLSPPRISPMMKTTSKSNISFVSGLSGIRISYSMKYPSAPAATIKSMRGSIRVILGMNIQSRDLSAAVTGAKKAFLPFMKNDSVSFTDFDRDPRFSNRYVMTMTVPRVRLPNGEMVEDSAEFAQLRFEAFDAAGRRWRIWKSTNMSNQSGPVIVTLRFDPPREISGEKDPKPPTKFAVIIPGKTEEVVLPFEFNDIPIPSTK